MKHTYTGLILGIAALTLISCEPSEEEMKRKEASPRKKIFDDKMWKQETEMEYTPYKNMSTDGLLKDK